MIIEFGRKSYSDILKEAEFFVTSKDGLYVKRSTSMNKGTCRVF